jgi:hypothetical protein
MVDLYVGPENTHWILHEKLLCYHSPFFRRVFYSKTNKSQTFGLPDDEDAPFKTFVGWLYSSSLPVPREEADLGILFDLYLMAEKFEIPSLIQDVLQVVREWYKFSDTHPGLRRVQYIYANTEDGSPMRHMLVHSVARLMVTGEGIPQHWDKALRKNGQLAVDIIKAIQDWKLDESVVPDARDDPADAEDLIGDDEIEAAEGVMDEDEEAARREGEAEEQGADEQDADEQEADEQDAEDDNQADEEEADQSGEETVVESPAGIKAPEVVNDMKKKGVNLVNGISKLGLKEVSNGMTNGDYGTLVKSS